jgi:hypothetical protein
MAHDELNLENLELLKVGRHFRLGGQARLVVGRNEGENNLLAQLALTGDYLFNPQKNLAGPTSLARGLINQELISLSSQITSAYTDVQGLDKIEVFYRQVPSDKDYVHQVAYLPKEKFAHLLV